MQVTADETPQPLSRHDRPFFFGPFGRCRALTLVLYLLTALPFLVWAVLLSWYSVDVYRVDQWYTPFLAIQAAFSGDLSLDILFQQHNEARKMVPTFISVVLALANGYWNTRLEIAFGFFLCIVLTVTMVLALRSTPGLRPWQVAFVTFQFSLLLWSPLTWYFHTYSITFERLIPELCILIGVWLYIRGLTTWTQVLVFSVLALISQFSFPGGLATWPLFLLLLVHFSLFSNRSGWLGVLSFTFICMGATVLYFWDYSRPPAHPEFIRVLDHSLTDILSFFLMVLGRSFANDYLPGTIVGLLLGALYLFCVLSGARKMMRERAFAAWTVVGLYSISQALLITVGRLHLSTESATRADYVIHSVYIYIASLVLLGLVAWRSGRRAGIPILLTGTFFTGILIGAVSESPIAAMRLQAHEFRQGRACIQLYPLLYQMQCPRWAYPWPAQMPARIKAANELGIINPRLVIQIERVPDVPVHGSVGVSFRVPKGIHFDGWAVVNGEIADAVVITGDTDEGEERVLGVFRSGVQRGDVARAMGEKFRYAGWAGDIAETELVYDSKQKNCGLRAYVFNIAASRFYPLDWKSNAVDSWCGRLP